MPSNTPNQGYYKPDAGQDGVADELNANWDAIDAALQGMSGDGTALDLGRVSSTDINNVLWATSPDDIQTQLDALPATGGTVNLIPDTYSDADWTQTITLPSDRSPAQYTVNMRGSNITLSTFSGPYIQKPASTANATHTHIFGPDVFDVSSVTTPGDVMDLWDIQGSIIHWPSCVGAVDAIIRKNAQNNSGHMCRVYVAGYGMQKGIVIGDQTDWTVSSDRCFWWGQLGGIEEIGIHVVNGQTNHFWVQPENDKSGFNATGYRMDKATNYIHNNHGKTSTPLDLRADTNVTAPRFEGFNNSLLASRPHGFTADRVSTQTDPFYLDSTTRYDTQNIVNGTFGLARLESGTTDSTVAYLGTHNKAGEGTQLAHCTFNQNTVDSSTIRFGAYDSASDWVALERTASDTTWQAVAVKGGSEVFRADTGHSVNGNPKEVTVGWNTTQDNYRLGILNGTAPPDRVYDVADPTVTGMSATLRPRLWLTTNGTPASGQRIDAKQFNLAYMD